MTTRYHLPAAFLKEWRRIYRPSPLVVGWCSPLWGMGPVMVQ